MTGETPPADARGAEVPSGWLPPASGSDWRVAPSRGSARYQGFAPPLARVPVPTRLVAGDRGSGVQAPLNGKAIASVVLGVCGFVVLPLLASVAAIVFGSLARGEIARAGTTRGTRLARVGIVLGVAGIILWIAVVAATTKGRT